MAFCLNCGAQLQDGAGFCNHCGAAQNTGGQATPQMQPQGGMQYQQPQGGMQYQQPPMQQPMQQQYQYQQQAPQQPQKKSKKGLIIGLACGGTVLLAGLVVLILFLTGVIGGNAGNGGQTNVVTSASTEGLTDAPTTEPIDTSNTGNTEETPMPEETARLSATATPEEVADFLAGGSWSMVAGGWGEGPASAEILFGEDRSVTFRMPMDEWGGSYAEVKGSYAVSYETQDRPYPDLLTLSFEAIPDEMPADYPISDEASPTEDFSFYIVDSSFGVDCLNLYITGNDGYSVIADRLFKEENQTSETFWSNENAGLYPVFDSGWVFMRFTEAAYNERTPEPEPKANADFYAMIWSDGDGMMLSYMKMEERSDVFFPGDHYYYFSYEGAPQIISGYDVDYDVMGDRHGKMPYSTGMGRMPCVMAHITTGADAKIIGMEFFTYAGFMHWDKWTGNATDTGDTGFTSYEEVLNYYRDVLPNIKKDEYDESLEGTLAGDLYTYYIGYWPEFPLSYFYYTISDIDGDGTEEMMVGTYDGTNVTFHQLFATGKTDGKVHLIASAGYRTYLSVNTDGSFSWGGSYSAASYTDFIYRLNETNDMRVFIEGYKYDDLEEIEGGPWYRAIPTGDMYEGYYEMDYEPITEAEANAMTGKYTMQVFQWKMLLE